MLKTTVYYSISRNVPKNAFFCCFQRLKSNQNLKKFSNIFFRLAFALQTRKTFLDLNLRIRDK